MLTGNEGNQVGYKWDRKQRKKEKKYVVLGYHEQFPSLKEKGGLEVQVLQAPDKPDLD